jgi:hypothetical protein
MALGSWLVARANCKDEGRRKKDEDGRTSNTPVRFRAGYVFILHPSSLILAV